MISEDDVGFYRENGYLLVRGVYNESEVNELRDSIDRLARRATNVFGAWEGEYISEEKLKKLSIKGLHDIHYHDANFTSAAIHPNMKSILARLIGPNVQLHHIKMIIKPPEIGAAYPMHQDYPYFPHHNHTMTAASVHLDDANQENGCLLVVPGSHKLGQLPVVNSKSRYLDPKQYPLESGTPCPAKAGDVLFFNYLTIHGSDNNRSSRTRRNFLMQYRDPEDLPAVGYEHVHANWGQGLMICGERSVFQENVQTGDWARTGAAIEANVQ